MRRFPRLQQQLERDLRRDGFLQWRAPMSPERARAEEIVEGMRQRGILIGTTGGDDNTLKIRPRLVFQRAYADQFVETLDRTFRSSGLA